jgi:Protein of unknown function (DUF3152)
LSTAVAAVQNGTANVIVPTRVVPAIAANANLAPRLRQLQQQLGVALGFVYNGQTVTPTKTDIGDWFTPNGQDITISTAKVSAYIDTVGRHFGVSVANRTGLAAAVAYALDKAQSLNFAIVPSGGKTIVRTYCVAVNGVNISVLAELSGKLAATYNDARGWNDSGRIAFEPVTSGCQYTVWMSAAAQMTSFGAICDNYYNCQVGASVILNYDRWTTATPPWNKAGGNLEDYHTLMIDHETGHRLGFLDNPTCPGPGQPAPVMMQQSINLHGCVFNVWPRPAEFTQLNSMLDSGQTSSITNLQ